MAVCGIFGDKEWRDFEICIGRSIKVIENGAVR